ncbi:MAG: TonB-dependent receptor plug domain-containing protein [Novosphingobium sp.]|nr:TonB-dependent receptor plug domain-containing protein [Novosphingobium sp.]
MRLKKRLAIGTATTLVLGLALASVPALAQDISGSSAAEGEESDEAIVVTGSRIRRSATDTTMPLTVVGAQDLTDRGYVSAAQALNNDPAVNRQLAQASGSGTGSGNGVQAPALFGLGTGRTLSLLNGRRMVTTSSGLGDSQVDANVIPTGLLSRVEVVKAGGAAVYGSDAIAGVVNYVLKRDFEGLEGDAQASVTSRGTIPPTARGLPAAPISAMGAAMSPSTSNGRRPSRLPSIRARSPSFPGSPRPTASTPARTTASPRSAR